MASASQQNGTKEINQSQFYASWKPVWAHFFPNSVFSDLIGNLKSIMVESALELCRFNPFIVLHVKEHSNHTIKCSLIIFMIIFSTDRKMIPTVTDQLNISWKNYILILN